MVYVCLRLRLRNLNVHVKKDTLHLFFFFFFFGIILMKLKKNWKIFFYIAGKCSIDQPGSAEESSGTADSERGSCGTQKLWGSETEEVPLLGDAACAKIW